MESALGFKDAVRDMGGLTVGLERRVLLWMAPRLPRAIHSDHLTALALLAMAGAGASYWLAGQSPAWFWGASLCLVINWFGDSLDGTLARVRQRQRPRYGFYVDHVVDAAGIVLLLGGLALSGYVRPLVAAGLVAGYFLVCIEIYLATYTLGRFRMSVGAIGGTELRLVLIAMNTTMALAPSRLFDTAALLAIAGLVVTFIASAVRNTRVLYDQERLAGSAVIDPEPAAPVR